MKTINEEIAELRKRLDELERQQSKGGVFVPADKQEHWYIDEYGQINTTWWSGERSDKIRLETGNCYPTKQAAEQVVLNRKIHRFLQEQTNFVADWNNSLQNKSWLIYNYANKEWDSFFGRYNHQYPNVIYFRDLTTLTTAAQAAIAKFGLEAFESYLKGSII